MKITCEKCHKDISYECCRNIENYRVGRITCPECQHVQKRYISQADLLLYFGLSEAAYVMLTFVTIFVYRRFGIGIIFALIMIMLLLLFFFLSKMMEMQIYEKAFFKEDIKNKVFDEDIKAIQRDFTWQFMLFFALTISYLTIEEGKIFFGIAMPLAVIMSFVKFFLQVRNEKDA